MPASDVIIASVNGPYGQVQEEGKNAGLHLTYNGGPNGAQSEYRLGEKGGWSPIPDGGIVVPVSSGDITQIRSLFQGMESQECEKVAPESDTHAAFQFSWPQPNAPSVTIEVRENSIEPA